MLQPIIINYKKDSIIVILYGELLFKQPFLKNKTYTLFYVFHILYKFGYLNKQYVYI
jgi:hypothetical protein